jgi:hypothetical protein
MTIWVFLSWRLFEFCSFAFSRTERLTSIRGPIFVILAFLVVDLVIYMPYNSFARREIDIEGRSMTYIGQLAQYEYEPYGGAFQFSGPTPDLGFTGHRWDTEAGMYWISTDPAGMVDGPTTWAG